MPFDLIPAFLMSVLATWLGLSLLARSPDERAAQTFAWLCLHLAIYGLAIVVGRLTSEPGVRGMMQRVEIIETVLLPPVWLHFILVVVDVPRWQLVQRVTLAVFYASGLALALVALSPQIDITVTPPRFPTPLLVACSLAQRVLPLLLSLWLVVRYLRSSSGTHEQGRRGFFASAVGIAVTGAFVASAAREVQFTPAPGHLLMDTGLAMMAYMVLAYRMLLPVRVAQRAFIRSLLGSLLTATFILLIVLVEPLSSRVLGVDTPLLTVFALVLLVAVFGPLRDAAGAWLDQRLFHREFDYGRLLRAVSDDLFQRGDLPGQLDAALTAICRTLQVQSGVVAVREGQDVRVMASYGNQPLPVQRFPASAIPETAAILQGDWQPWPQAELLLPLRRADETHGLLILGAKHSGEAYGEVERVLLDSLGRYLALAITHARTQQEEELAMAALAEQSRQLAAEQAQLEAQALEAQRRLAEVRPAPPASATAGLRVATLGPLRVERGGGVIERWGGEKAGNHQAEALFAFLFDRRGKGLTKDEAEEVIWPDLTMDKADTAFHRTVSALRRTLEPGLRRGNESKLIAYHHERYWLDPGVVEWCDADEYVQTAARGQTQLRQGDFEGAKSSFERANQLYRGDYMDDCPFYGDSAEVEERREQFRQQQVQVLLGLGAIYEQFDLVGEATQVYRRALAVSQDDCPKAELALERLGV